MLPQVLTVAAVRTFSLSTCTPCQRYFAPSSIAIIACTYPYSHFAYLLDHQNVSCYSPSGSSYALQVQKYLSAYSVIPPCLNSLSLAYNTYSVINTGTYKIIFLLHTACKSLGFNYFASVRYTKADCWMSVYSAHRLSSPFSSSSLSASSACLFGYKCGISI